MPALYPESDIAADTPPLRVEYKCNRCEAKRAEEFAWATVSPEREHADGWDGICLSRTITCKKCGAVDDYSLMPMSLMGIRLRGIMGAGVHSADGRITMAEGRLWDGTPVRRPSQVLAHLHKLTEQAPIQAESFRRLGNALERFGDLPAALVAWQRAHEIDPQDVEALYSLTNAYVDAENEQALAVRYMILALAALPPALRANPELRRFVEPIVGILNVLIRATDEPFALMAAWSDGEARGHPLVNVSSVDAHKIRNFKRLAAFIADPSTISLGVVLELPTDEPTRLQLLLEGDPLAAVRTKTAQLLGPARAARVAPVVGRNAPCPCGSGKKFKRCCGG